nr:AI-2E family transporter [Acidobacteriota bacterium]
MAKIEGDEEKTTVYKTHGQDGEPLSTRMPVDIRSVTLTTIAALSVILVLQYAQLFLIPVVLGVLISYVLGPAVTSMAKHHIPRPVGAFLVIATLCGSLGFGVYTLSDEVVDIVDDMPRAAEKLRDRMHAPQRTGED